MNGFALWIGLGASIGVWRVARDAPAQETEFWANLSLIILAAALAGARFFYVLTNASYFAAHLLESAAVWQGGLSWAGAAFGAALAVAIISRTARPPAMRRAYANATSQPRRFSMRWIADRLYPLLPSIAITAWIGSWQVGAAYGVLLPPQAWWGVPGLDENILLQSRFPLQPLAAFTLLLFFLILETRVKALSPPGRLSGLAVIGLLLHTLAASLLRADPSPTWHGLRVDAWFAIFGLTLYLAAVIGQHLMLRLRPERRLSSSLPK